MNKPSVLLVADSESEPLLRRALAEMATLAGSSAAPDQLADECRRVGAEVAIVAVGHDPQAAFRRVTALVAAGVRVVVAGPAKDPDLILGGGMQYAAEDYASTNNLVTVPEYWKFDPGTGPFPFA